MSANIIRWGGRITLESIIKKTIASLIAIGCLSSEPAVNSEFPYRLFKKDKVRIQYGYFPNGASYGEVRKAFDNKGAKDCGIIDFITAGTFYSKNKSIGLIRNEGEVLTNGISKHGTYLTYANGVFQPCSSNTGQRTIMGGLIQIIKNYEVQPLKNRRVETGPARRVAFAFYDNTFFIMSGNYSLSGLCQKAKGLGVKDLVLVDGGSSSLHYEHNIYKMKPYRKVITVIYGKQR